LTSDYPTEGCQPFKNLIDATQPVKGLATFNDPGCPDFLLADPIGAAESNDPWIIPALVRTQWIKLNPVNLRRVLLIDGN